MTSREFENAARRMVINMLADRGIKAEADELQLVWFSHLLGNKKCMVYGPVMGNLYAEITYSLESQLLYADLYQKLDHREVHDWEME